ncbi:MAG: FAD-dependent thymidylate synthase [Oxalobacteraceae bacterium]|nr:FAD-dependent thymidylate synthase [Oxalobacteraceae bacterium]
MKVTEISVTRHLSEDITPEQLIVQLARVSSPQNQQNHDTAPKLIGYLMRKGHWSPFEMVDWTIEIHTTRAIAAQLLRHRSFSFQEFSQRYATVASLGESIELPELRMKHEGGNRQGSGEVCDDELISIIATRAIEEAHHAYDALIKEGIAPECARMVLPLCTPTRLYMKGSVRSWIHYLNVRCSPDTQKEHREIALAIYDLFKARFPVIGGHIYMTA